VQGERCHEAARDKGNHVQQRPSRLAWLCVHVWVCAADGFFVCKKCELISGRFLALRDGAKGAAKRGMKGRTQSVSHWKMVLVDPSLAPLPDKIPLLFSRVSSPEENWKFPAAFPWLEPA